MSRSCSRPTCGLILGHSPPSVSLVLAAAWIGIGAALAQEHLPTVPGTCVLTKIASIGDRLQNASIGRPIFGFGSAVTFTNKGYQVSYNQLPVDIPLQRGDGVYMCLMKVPKGCPPGDNRGRIYTTMNLRIWSPGRCRIHLSEQGERKLRGRSEPVRVWISRH